MYSSYISLYIQSSCDLMNGERQQHTGLTLQSIIYLLWGEVRNLYTTGYDGGRMDLQGLWTKTTFKKKIGRGVGCKLANNTVLSTARFVQTARILHDFKVYICKTQLRHQVYIIQSLHFCFIYSTFLVKIQQNWHTCKHFLPRQDPLSFLDWPKISQIDQNQ